MGAERRSPRWHGAHGVRGRPFCIAGTSAAAAAQSTVMEAPTKRCAPEIVGGRAAECKAPTAEAAAAGLTGGEDDSAMPLPADIRAKICRLPLAAVCKWVAPAVATSVHRRASSSMCSPSSWLPVKAPVTSSELLRSSEATD